jgi:hypothetical protein
MIVEFYKEYQRLPSQVIDPDEDFSEFRRDMIDILFMQKGDIGIERIQGILSGKRPISNDKPFRSDPFPKPSNFEELKRRGGKIWQKLAKESGWL